MPRSFKIQSPVKWCLSFANTTRTCDSFTVISFIVSKITDIHIKVMCKSNEKSWPTACQHSFPSKGLLSCPGNMVPRSINKLQGTVNSTPPSILVHMDLTKLLYFHFSLITEYPDGVNIYLQKSLSGKNESFASTVLVNHTVAGVLGGQLECQRIPLVQLS